MSKEIQLDYISQMVLDSYKENIPDKSYIADMEIKLDKNETKLDGLFSVFNMDEKNRRTFANKLNVHYEDLTVFLTVLQKV